MVKQVEEIVVSPSYHAPRASQDSFLQDACEQLLVAELRSTLRHFGVPVDEKTIRKGTTGIPRFLKPNQDVIVLGSPIHNDLCVEGLLDIDWARKVEPKNIKAELDMAEAAPDAADKAEALEKAVEKLWQSVPGLTNWQEFLDDLGSLLRFRKRPEDFGDPKADLCVVVRQSVAKSWVQKGGTPGTALFGFGSTAPGTYASLCADAQRKLHAALSDQIKRGVLGLNDGFFAVFLTSLRPSRTGGRVGKVEVDSKKLTVRPLSELPALPARV
jgi:hypothetical protein